MTTAATDSPAAVLKAEEAGQEAQPEPKPEFSLQVSPDNMTAYLRTKPAFAGQKVTYEEIYEFLKQQGIEYGICENAIHSFCDEGRYFSELICAKGLPPVDGEDGVLDYKFNTEKSLKPKEREDGTVDYRELGLVQNVNKGDVLCSITPPTEGKDGIDIYNHVVPLKPGRMPVLPVGNNTVVSEDQLSLLADVDGCIEFLKTKVNINDVFIVRGDVDNTSGNIVANGSVVVQGDVRQGFSIKAGQDITVRGMVEGAVLEAKGSITISNGMNGMGRGVLKAGGNIAGKYFENATLECENDIYADVLMICRVTAAGSIILKGKKASMIGGIYEVGRRVYLKCIGTPGNAVTRISIQSKDLSALFASDPKENGLDALNARLEAAQQELDDFREKYEVLTAQLNESGQAGTERGHMLIKASIMKKAQLTEKVEEIKKQVETAKENASTLIDYSVIATGVVYPGTKITIGIHSMNVVNEYSNSKFYADQERIVFGPVLPSDIISEY